MIIFRAPNPIYKLQSFIKPTQVGFACVEAISTARYYQTAFLGNSQVRWLKNQLLYSKAIWKVIASDMPIGLLVKDGKSKFENASNGDGVPLKINSQAKVMSVALHNKIGKILYSIDLPAS